MNQNDVREPSPGDEEERRKRAAELHEQIEQLKTGSRPDTDDAPRRPSPREFTEPSVREEVEHERANGEDC